MDFATTVIAGAALGLGATIFTDAAGCLRQGWAATHGFYCLVGRWIGLVPRVGVLHDDIRSAPSVVSEAAVGWAAHIALGLLYGIGFVALFGPTALGAPKLWQGVGFGLVTVLVPWLIFQPLFGWGIAGSKMPKPWQLRLRGAVTHTIFGIGLWLSACVAKGLVG